MKFVRTEDLKEGMRLAHPIYSKTGVLLYERNSKLSSQGIESVKNFGLLGIYVLEPAEPLPPMSEENIEFERFQTMTIASLSEELKKLFTQRKKGKLSFLADNLLRLYGHLDEKITFYQNLRSRDDFVYCHSLNVAILCAMITHKLNLRREEQLSVVCSALVHDIGKLGLTGPNAALAYSDDLDEDDRMLVYQAQLSAGDILEEAFAEDPNVKRSCMQVIRRELDLYRGQEGERMKMVTGARILLVANQYDKMTAMSLSGNIQSEVRAIQEFLNHPEIYDPEVVDALIASVNILFSGVSVELSTGEKALVLTENPRNILMPTVLCFRDNSIVDLSLPENGDIQIVDIMKTMDNRYIMNTEAIIPQE